MLVLVVDHVQCVQSLVDQAEFYDGLREPRRIIADLQNAHDAGEPQYVVQCGEIALQAEPVLRDGVELSIIALGVDAPEACSSDVR